MELNKSVQSQINNIVASPVPKNEIIQELGTPIFFFGTPNSITGGTGTASLNSNPTFNNRNAQSVQVQNISTPDTVLSYTGLNIKVLAGDIFTFLVYADRTNGDLLNKCDFSINGNGVKLSGLSNAANMHGWNANKWVATSDIVINQIQITINATSSATVYLDSIIKNYKMKPCILLNFDDITDTFYSTTYPLLKSYEFLATGRAGGDGTSSVNAVVGGPGLLTLAHYKEMVNNGWDFSMYDGAGARPASVTDMAQYNNWVTYFNTLLTAMLNAGVAMPVAYFCKSNISSDLFVQALSSLGFKIVRCSKSRVYTQSWDPATMEFLTAQISDQAGVLATIKGNIDTAIAQGSCLSIFTHQLVSAIDGSGTNCSIYTYTQLLNYLKTKVDAGLCEVVTYRDFYNRYMNNIQLPSVKDIVKANNSTNYLQQSASAVPTSGVWNVACNLWNSAPAPSGVLGWVNTRFGMAAPVWVGTTAYKVGDNVVPTVDNGHVYTCTVAGTTSATQPTWPTANMGTIVDGTVTWQENGTACLFKSFGTIAP